MGSLFNVGVNLLAGRKFYIQFVSLAAVVICLCTRWFFYREDGWLRWRLSLRFGQRSCGQSS